MTVLAPDPDLKYGQYIAAERERRRALIDHRDFDTLTAQRRRDAEKDIARYERARRRAS